MSNRNRLATMVAVALLFVAAFVNPLSLRAMGLLLYTQPIPKSGFWLLATLALGMGLLMLAARRSATSKRLALAWASTSLAILGIEAALRWDPPVEVTGASKIPKVEFNSLGTWDAEPRFDAKLRVLTLGDSVTHGVGDFLNQTNRYHDLLEKRLSSEGFDVDIQSVAESGWSLQRYMLEYDRVAPIYKPQVVLIGWCMNDINYGNAAALVQGNAEGGNRPTAQSLRWRIGQLARSVRLNESYLCTLAQKRGSQLLKRFGVVAGDWIDEHQTTYFKRMADWWTSQPLLAQIRADLGRLKRDCDANGRQLVVAIFPYSFQIHGDHSAVAAFRSMLEQLGIRYVDLCEVYRQSGATDLYSYRDEAHPNIQGHDLAAQALLPALRQALQGVHSGAP